MGRALRRVCVLGCSGAGKSHLARALSRRAGLPYVELDRHFWKAGWVEPDEASWRSLQRDLVAAPRWVLDGNYHSTYDERLPFADTVLVVDTPRWRCLMRILLRRFRQRRSEVLPGCPARVRASFLRYVWRFPRRSLPPLLAALDALPAEVRVHRLRSRRDVDRFLGEVSR